jgi:hypothetical protein
MSRALAEAGLRRLWMEWFGGPVSFAHPLGAHCCAAMDAALAIACPDHVEDPFACGDMVLCYSPLFDEYGLIVHDGGQSYILIERCPWCGAFLPEGRRDDWFDALEAMGIDSPFDPGAEVPERYRSHLWWSSRGE